MISEALSTLRLRFGEPVRFRFLVGMLQSAAGSGDLQAAGLAFINALLASAPSPQRKLYLQAELEQAGFDIVTLKKTVARLPNASEHVTREIGNYEKQLIDIDTLNEKANEAQKEKDDLRSKLELLEKRVKILQEEKGILLSLEKCLQEKCCVLQEEVSTLRSEHGNSSRKKGFASKKKNSAHKNREESSPPEDEGISSSERSLSPEVDQRDSMVYEVFNIKNETYDLLRNKRNHKKLDSKKDHKKSSDEEDETTIDEVIQELRNIVNHAEIENVRCERPKCNSDMNDLFEKEDSITSTRHSIQITNKDDDNVEAEIVPTKILPHPPRKAKSLIHLMPVEGLIYKADAFEEIYSSDEGSDSLLSASRCQNHIQKATANLFGSNENRSTDGVRRSKTRSREDYKKSSVKRSESFQNSENSRQREHIDNMFLTQSTEKSRVDEIVSLIESKKLTKSLDRIDEGLNSMVDIVMTNEPKKNWSYEKRQRSVSRTNSEIEMEDPLTSNVQTYDSKIYKYDPKSNYKTKEDLKSDNKFNTKLSTGSFEAPNFNTFIMKRGSTSGFYSGSLLRDAPASMTSLVMAGTHSYSDLKKNTSVSSGGYGMHKVTDMPSGLY